MLKCALIKSHSFISSQHNLSLELQLVKIVLDLFFFFDVYLTIVINSLTCLYLLMVLFIFTDLIANKPILVNLTIFLLSSSTDTLLNPGEEMCATIATCTDMPVCMPFS